MCDAEEIGVVVVGRRREELLLRRGLCVVWWLCFSWRRDMYWSGDVRVAVLFAGEAEGTDHLLLKTQHGRVLPKIHH